MTARKQATAASLSILDLFQGSELASSCPSAAVCNVMSDTALLRADMGVNKPRWGVRQITQWLKEKSSCDLELWIHGPTDLKYYSGHELKGVPGRFKPLGAGLCEDLMGRGMGEGAQGNKENWSWSSSWSSQQSDCCRYFHGLTEIQFTSQYNSPV